MKRYGFKETGISLSAEAKRPFSAQNTWHSATHGCLRQPQRAILPMPREAAIGDVAAGLCAARVAKGPVLSLPKGS